MRRIFSGILAVIMLTALMGIQTISYARENDADKLNILTGLGIINEVPSGENVTRLEFARYIYAIMSEEEKSDEDMLEYLNYMRVISGKVSEFDPERAIKFEEAVKMTVSMMGEDIFARMGGGYPNEYVKIASEYKLLKNVDSYIGKEMSFSDCVSLLYNAIEYDRVVDIKDISGEKLVFENTGKTILAKYRNIYKASGIFTSLDYTGLSGESSIGVNMIQIGNDEYITDENNFKELFGMAVDAYYVQEKNSDDKKIVFIAADSEENSEISFDGDDIENISDNYEQITYSNGDKTRKIKLNPAFKVIYNGKADGTYTEEDFTSSESKLRFLDNDDDGKYDVVFITAYKTMVVNYSAANDGIVNNLYTFDKDSLFVSFDINDEDIYHISVTDEDGTKLDVDEISKYNVLSIAASRGEEKKIIEVKCANILVKGTVSGLDEEKGVCIEDKWYKLSKVYKDAVDAGDNYATQLTAGMTYKIFLNVFGEAAYAEIVSDSGFKYGYLYKVYEEDDEELYVYARIFSEDGKWQDYKLKEKVKINNEISKSPASVLSNEGIGKLIQYRTNKSEEIAEIRLPEQTDKTTDSSLRVVIPGGASYRTENNAFDDKYFTDSKTKVFSIPEDSDDYNLYTVSGTGFLKGNHGYPTIQFYNPDDFNVPEAIMISYDSTEIRESVESQPFFIVTGKGKGLYDDSPAPTITGSYGDYIQTTFYGADNNVFDDVEKGDIIYCRFNGDGMVTSVDRKAFSMSDGAKKVNPGSTYTNLGIYSGIVEKIDFDRGLILLDCGSNVVFRIGKTSMISYTEGDKNVQKLNTTDLKTGDYVVVRVSWCKISNIARIKFK